MFGVLFLIQTLQGLIPLHSAAYPPFFSLLFNKIEHQNFYKIKIKLTSQRKHTGVRFLFILYLTLVVKCSFFGCLQCLCPFQLIRLRTQAFDNGADNGYPLTFPQATFAASAVFSKIFCDLKKVHVVCEIS